MNPKVAEVDIVLFRWKLVIFVSVFFLRNKKNIFDPFAGWGERGAKAKEYGKNYVGCDISKETIRFAKSFWNVRNTLGDSRSISIKPFDGLFTCPPYWNLEKYSSKRGLDRIKTWKEFLIDLEFIFRRCYEAAEEEAIFCIVVGDWRKRHCYYDLTFQVQKMFDSFGCTVIDKVVLSRKAVSKIKIMLPQAKRLGYTVKVHENLLVFKKPKNE